MQSHALRLFRQLDLVRETQAPVTDLAGSNGGPSHMIRIRSVPP